MSTLKSKNICTKMSLNKIDNNIFETYKLNINKIKEIYRNFKPHLHNYLNVNKRKYNDNKQILVSINKNNLTQIEEFKKICKENTILYNEIEISKKLRITKKCSFIDIWSININRIENKLNELIYICNNQLPEFVLIQETYHTMPLYINNYICIDQFKDNNNHGMLILIRKNIECSYDLQKMK
ncbi:hypothetical protein EHP00_1498 [Ecytonucleospora hepatopenaei]|uniref:Uncharacterized protein n=1 Tax=Ecytonucleospora hepatopenaei TaxID=646526 RepID=A0A1W0E3Q2_9MICR|nr:hypothetical protein EHP00_1498 [Ecytonucleospora hepatopenaei]